METNPIVTDWNSSYKDSLIYDKRIAEIVRPFAAQHATVRARKSDLKEDSQEGTDFVFTVLHQIIRLSCRVRNPGVKEQYLGEFTITSRRENGKKCEYDTVITDGWCDWMFYAHAPDLTPRVLIDLKTARPIIKDAIDSGRIKEGPRNRDADGKGCWFYAFPIVMIQDCLIHRIE